MSEDIDDGFEQPWTDWWLLEQIADTGTPGMRPDAPGMVWLVRQGLVRHLGAQDRWMLTRTGRRELFHAWRDNRAEDLVWLRSRHIPVLEELPVHAVGAEIRYAYSGELTAPPVPASLVPHVTVQDIGCFGTVRADRLDMYVDMFVAERAGAVRFLAEGTSSYVAFCHSGHGVNSYSFNYELVTDRVAVFVKTAGFGAYNDHDEVVARANRVHAQIAELIEAAENAPSWPHPARLVAIQDELRGHSVLGWLDGSLGYDQGDDRLARVADWVASHSTTSLPLDDAICVATGIELVAVEPDSQGWQEFEMQVAKRIACLGEETRHCSFSEGPYYVQVAWVDDDAFVVEAVSNEYLEGPARLTDRQHRMLLDRGWLAPDLGDGWPNYRRYYEEAPILEIARELVAVLGSVYGVAISGCAR